MKEETGLLINILPLLFALFFSAPLTLCLQVLILIISTFVHFQKQQSTNEGQDKPAQTEETNFEEPLTQEEQIACLEAKKIVEREREKFLKQNGGFVPMASDPVQNYLKEAMEKFEKNLGETNSENIPWVLQHENATKEIQIYSSNFPGYSCKRWKIVAVLKSSLSNAYDAIFIPEQRRKWDALVKDINMLQINDCDKSIGDGIAITSIVTNQVLVVKSRAMLDLALQACHKRGGILIANVSCPSHFDEAKMNPNISGSVKAVTHIGSGASIRPLAGRPGYLEYILISTIDLGGWLPPSVINATMTTSLAQSTEQMQEFLLQKT